jgi:hypothetical protein
LHYKNIPNVYPTTDEYIKQYFFQTLKSLSFNTLKLLAVNPLYDLDHLRHLHAERALYHASLPPKSPEQSLSDLFSALKNIQ